MTTSNYVCIHGHFYQPPRENPFTGIVDSQSSAAPFDNWNERITAEAYRANLSAPILGEDGETVGTLNNYEWISFDFGPTLLSWLEESAPDTYEAIIAADTQSARHYGGHGSAMAQPYNHTILPLSNSRDKRTQIRWGIADFEHRFGRSPEGMWLPETAVDLEALEILADEGIAFTVLSPHQAAAVQDGDEWVDVTGGRVDPRVPYLVDLPHGRSITVFFYDGAVSQDVAFGGLLEDGRILAKRMMQALGEPIGEPVLAHVATDGETYGHHHRFGEMALAMAISEIRGETTVEVTNYAQFLAIAQPATRAKIIERSSWSCVHGVERWRYDCGCSTGANPTWNQSWRAPLRDALDWLRDELAGEFEIQGRSLFRDVWAARDAYIEVVLGRPDGEFIDDHAVSGLDDAGREKALALLEIQHRAMLMYTSCGWFFDDISGLEGVFVLRQAGRAIELARSTLGLDLEPHFVHMLEEAPSNLGGTGAEVYETEVARFTGYRGRYT